jgi:predicted metallo-beta-lactamase superfamily hydrolase
LWAAPDKKIYHSGVFVIGKMLKHIRVVPLAAESLGVRSMCTYVESSSLKLLLDAGVSLCPCRFGLPPHPEEFRAIVGCRRKIAEAAEEADVVTLSHYHFDHHTPSYEDWLSQWTEETETARQIYDGKIVLLKNPREMVNYSQRQRGWMFQKTGGSYAKKLEVADGKSFKFGDTEIRFSEPVFHGPENSFLGWVLMATVECEGDVFMFAPDVQGPISSRTLQLIISEKPELLMLGGPPSYLVGFKTDERQVQTAMNNLERIVERVPTTILEHHLLRDENWKERSAEVFYQAYASEHTVLTAAEYLGQQNKFLEASRKKLFSEDRPSAEFEKWMNTSLEAKKRLKPPV